MRLFFASILIIISFTQAFSSEPVKITMHPYAVIDKDVIEVVQHTTGLIDKAVINEEEAKKVIWKRILVDNLLDNLLPKSEEVCRKVQSTVTDEAIRRGVLTKEKAEELTRQASFHLTQYNNDGAQAEFTFDFPGGKVSARALLKSDFFSLEDVADFTVTLLRAYLFSSMEYRSTQIYLEAEHDIFSLIHVKEYLKKLKPGGCLQEMITTVNGNIEQNYTHLMFRQFPKNKALCYANPKKGKTNWGVVFNLPRFTNYVFSMSDETSLKLAAMRLSMQTWFASQKIDSRSNQPKLGFLDTTLYNEAIRASLKTRTNDGIDMLANILAAEDTSKVQVPEVFRKEQGEIVKAEDPRVEPLRVRLTELEEILKKLDAENKKAHQTIQDLQKKIEEKEKRISNQGSELTRQNKVLASRKEELDSVKFERDDIKKQIAELEKELNEAKLGAEKATADKSGVEKAKEKLQRRIAEKAKDLSDLKDKLDQAEKTAQALEAKVGVETLKIKEAEMRLMESEFEVASLKTELAELHKRHQEELKEAEAKALTAESKLTKLEEEISLMKKILTRAEEEAARMFELIDAQKKEELRLAEEAEKKESSHSERILELQTKIAELEKRSQVIEEVNIPESALKEELAELKDRHLKLLTSYTAILHENRALFLENSAFKSSMVYHHGYAEGQQVMMYGQPYVQPQQNLAIPEYQEDQATAHTQYLQEKVSDTEK